MQHQGVVGAYKKQKHRQYVLVKTTVTMDAAAAAGAFLNAEVLRYGLEEVLDWRRQGATDDPA